MSEEYKRIIKNCWYNLLQIGNIKIIEQYNENFKQFINYNKKSLISAALSENIVIFEFILIRIENKFKILEEIKKDHKYNELTLAMQFYINESIKNEILQNPKQKRKSSQPTI